MEKYTAAIEREMKKFYTTLSEKDKRRYAALEALKLGYGGLEYISTLLGCSQRTIHTGIKELKDLPDDLAYDPRTRRPGGGRKSYEEVFEHIDEKFLDVLKHYTAGDPTNEHIVWTNLTYREIADLLFKEHGIKVSVTVIKKLLRKHNYRRRKAQKKKAMKEVENKDEQFEKIASLKAEYEETDNPILSMDTKKKEVLGDFYREGYLYTREVVPTYDHDFHSFASGVVIPHGIYDVKQNTGYITLGISKDTSEFSCDCLRSWWYTQGQYDYPEATSILILCDCGGSNSARYYIFKEDLQSLVDEIGVEIRMAHYPPYHSKYNPIEHRVFPHVTRACQGVILKSLETVKSLIEKTTTRTGLKVVVQIIDKIYQTGRKVTESFKEKMKILFDEELPSWNYRVVPSQS